MKKIIVSKEECIGCGFCVGAAPEVFEFSEDGLSNAKIETMDTLSDEVTTAVENCPTGAIKVEDAN